MEHYKTGSLNNEVRISLGNGTISNNIVAYTETGATSGFDFGKDVKPFVAQSSVEMSFVNQSDNYTINALDVIDGTTELPFYFKVADAGNYVLELSAYEVAGLTPYLKDKQTNTLTDLTPGNVATLNLPAGVAVNGRYSIVFSNATTGITEVENKAVVFANKNMVFVNRNSTNLATVQVFNALGQELISKTIAGNKETITLDNISSECVIVRITEGGNVQNKRVVINN